MLNGAMMLPEFDAELASTRRMFAAIPDEKLDLKPHEKSFAQLHLAAHVPNLPNWIGMTLATDELDLAEGLEQPDPENMADVSASLDEAAEEALAAPWTLKTGDEAHFAMPRGVVLRSLVFNHTVHHRTQLGVYLRLLDIPVPGTYGPSADETM